jgi:hypothetical protein
MNALTSRLNRVEKALVGTEPPYIVIHGCIDGDYPPTHQEIAEARKTGTCFILRGKVKELIE